MDNLFKKKYTEAVQRFHKNKAIEHTGMTLSYEEFDKIVQSITFFLKEHHIVHTAIVVCNDDSVYSYAAIVAINLTGNCIVPIELSWPEDRITGILDAVKPAGILIGDSSLLPPFFKERSLFIADILHLSSSPTVGAAKSVLPVKDYKGIAYIIFTSGSTGLPKGVPVKQESLNAFLLFYISEYEFTEQDRFLQVYDITFDVAYFSFLVPLCMGACCCLLTRKNGVPRYLSILHDLSQRQITVVSMVPTVLHFIKKYLNDFRSDSVRYSFFSGDALYHSEAILWKACLPNALIHNFYGPTETTIVCTRYIWSEKESAAESLNDIVPLGQLFPGMRAMIVNELNEEVPLGETGELALSGVQVIDHYLNNLYPHYFFEDKNDSTNRYYKTGDLASMNQYGNLVFHGRLDSQVKINGYRIELSEPEHALQRVTGKKAVLIKASDKNNISYLKAFIEGDDSDTDAINARLRKVLPSYMIPAEYVFIKQLPLNQNGKINKQLLKILANERA